MVLSKVQVLVYVRMGGGESRPPGLRRLAHATANFGHTKPSTVSVFERPEELRTRENLERICKMSDDERFARLCNSNLTILYEKSRLLWNLECPGFVDSVKLWKCRFSLCPRHFKAYQGNLYVICCVVKGCELIRNALKRCHLSSGSHSSGMGYPEHIWEAVFSVEDHGRIT